MQNKLTTYAFKRAGTEDEWRNGLCSYPLYQQPTVTAPTTPWPLCPNMQI